MPLPTEEEYAIGKTKSFVTKHDVERFKDYTDTLSGFVKPIEMKIDDCDIRDIIEISHETETAIHRMNQEIVRMIRFSSRDMKNNVEKAAREYQDLKHRYDQAKKNLYNECSCSRKK